MAAVVLAAVALIAVVAGGRTSVATAEGLSISGTVWFDDDADGAMEIGEPRLRSTLVLYGPGGIRVVARATERGEFVFRGLEAGEYTVSLDVRSSDGYASSVLSYPRRDVSPPYLQAVTLGSQSVINVNFGLALPDDSPYFSGLAWVNAAPAEGNVRAFIDGVDCTGPAPIIPPDSAPNSYYISVLSSAWLEGCGDPGDVITFTIGGVPANETAAWQPTGRDGFANDFSLTAGPPFAVFWPSVSEWEPGTAPREFHTPVVAAMIDGVVCATYSPSALGGDALIIKQQGTPGGCGYEGALVEFAVDGYAVEETARWHPTTKYGELVLRLDRKTAPTAGPRFAYYDLDFPALPESYVGSREQFVEARIDETFCGSAGGEVPARIEIAVAPAELVPGCGKPGERVRFYYQGRRIGSLVW
jgi:hypothetical protein